MLSSEIINRILKPGEVLGLQMKMANLPRTFFWKVSTVEFPDNLADYTLGSASALNLTGTAWQEITDNANHYYLEPEANKIIYQVYFGIAPGQAYIYRAYPANRAINSLIGTRPIGPPPVPTANPATGVGFIDGHQSPYRQPSVLSELFCLKDTHPAFLGYHPYAEPSSITVRLYFYIVRYDVVYQGIDLAIPAVVRQVGGHDVADAPAWVQMLAGG